MSAQNVLELIGHTPLVKVNKLDTGLCELYLKLESANPGGSIKDRIALSMINAAEKDGALKPGGTIVEATAGNTGLGLALVASQKNYPIILVVPDKMSQEKIFHLKALGAKIILTRSDVTKGHPEYYQDLAQRIASETSGGFYVNQFENPANPVTHERSTGPELQVQTVGKLDAMVVGVGSGGTLTGLGRYFKKHMPQVEMVLADPEGSILAPYVNTGVMITPGSWVVEGIGEDFIPKNCDLSLVKKAYTVSDNDSIATARAVLLKEGLLCGSSSGTLITAALRYCREQTTPKRVVTIVCDTGSKYLSKIYNEYWLHDHGFIQHTLRGDLRDVIARPHPDGQAVTIQQSDTLGGAYRKMRMYDVSQLPVMNEGKIAGILSEADILLAIQQHREGFELPVSGAMVRDLATVQASAGIAALDPVFKKDMVAIVMDGPQFLGLITPIDLLQYLRKQSPLAQSHALCL
ncbi:MAG: pyridoxal-phosphate dependent enzyme [Proteobacteria bacterium]|nr:pyridoxal-phosphate dependent enzyme [Pseudomonadota bacterium]